MPQDTVKAVDKITLTEEFINRFSSELDHLSLTTMNLEACAQRLNRTPNPEEKDQSLSKIRDDDFLNALGYKLEQLCKLNHDLAKISEKLQGIV